MTGAESITWLIAVASAVSSFLGAFLGMRVELRWHRREIERAHARLDAHDEILMNELRRSGL